MKGHFCFSGRPQLARRLAAQLVLSVLLLITPAASLASPLTPSDAPGPVAAPVPPQPVVAAGNDSAAAAGYAPYIVHVAQPSLLVVADRADDLVAQARSQQAEELAGVLAQMQVAGQVGTYAYDEANAAFRATLTDAAYRELQGNPLVAAIEPDPGSPAEPAQTAGQAPRSPRGQSGVSSVIFAEINSPFLWGNTNLGGLSVVLTLEDGSGNLKGVPKKPNSGACTTTANCVKVDASLYFETTFVISGTSTYVGIRPGDVIHVITSGDDPSTPGADAPEDKRITVPSLTACSSPELDRVTGSTSVPNAPMVVTISTNLNVPGSYLTPGNGMTYAELTSDGSGYFQADSFRTSTDPTSKSKDFVQGTLGFVRVKVPNALGQFGGDEVFTVYGQNAYVLENSAIMHAYAYGLPSAPGGLATGVVAPRPSTTISVTLRDESGNVKGSVGGSVGGRYGVGFADQTILGGDRVDVQISYGPVLAFSFQVPVLPITALADLAANQVVGTGPANTRMVVRAGNIQGYVTESSTINLMTKRPTSDASGSYASGPITCGTSNVLTLRRGSSGWVGYEGACGNFVYVAFAAPINYVMSDFPFVDGWIAKGTDALTIAVSDSNGVTKQAATSVVPKILQIDDQSGRWYINTYYNSYTTINGKPLTWVTVFPEPGDIVTIQSGSQTYTIRVDELTARLYADVDTVAGRAPAGGALRVVPEKDRASHVDVTANARGGYAAANPYQAIDSSTCALTSKTESLAFGDIGRVFLSHADGNEVFTTFYTRAIHALENEKQLWLTGYTTRAIGWFLPREERPLTVTFTAATGGTSGASSPLAILDGNLESKSREKSPSTVSAPFVELSAYIRFGGDLAATFLEGPKGGPNRPVTMTLRSLALITGTPDTDDDTLAGVGPVRWSGPDADVLADYDLGGWSGTLYLKEPASAASNTALPARKTTAYPPLQFKSGSTVRQLEKGYRGTVDFFDPIGNEEYMWWGATADSYEVRITGLPAPGATQVCGLVTGPDGWDLNIAVAIHDVTDNPIDVILGTGQADAGGHFCVAVSPALVVNHVIMAAAGGAWSQPVIIQPHLYLPYTRK